METAPQYFLDFAKQMHAQFDRVDTRFDRVDQRLNGIDTRLNGMDEKIDLIAATVLEHSEILRRLDPQVGSHEERIARLERSVAQLRFSKS